MKIINESTLLSTLQIAELVKAFNPIIDLEGMNEILKVEDDIVSLETSGEKIIEYVKPTKSNIKPSIFIKLALYTLLSSFFEKNLTWGILTGVRPGKIIDNFKNDGLEAAVIESILSDIYKIRMDKVQKLISINKQQAFADKYFTNNSYSLYISIPFCPTKCNYCSFPTIPLDKIKVDFNSYVDLLIKEMKELLPVLSNNRPTTIYIGGGTPTTLPNNELFKLLKFITTNFNSYVEFTVEAGRPDTINCENAKIMKTLNVDRLSINPQTFNDKTLERIGRRHSCFDTYKAVEISRSVGIENINTDIILGLENENIEDINKTLEALNKIKPESITAHVLSYKKGSRKRDEVGLKELEKDSLIENMVNITSSFANENNYIPYYLYRQKASLGGLENTGYSLKHRSCIYNIAIMEEKQMILGIGLGAVSKIVFNMDKSMTRHSNFKDIKSFSTRFNEMIYNKAKVLNSLLNS